MIKNLNIIKYRKLENLKLSMSPYINIISGTNRTCKSSLLHIISNAHQAVTKNCTWLKDKECLDIIKQINGITNPKIESLTKGDKAYNDPSNGVAGTLFTVDYFNHNPLEFRKHNSKISNRYAVKPYYRRGSDDKLPFCPIIYLGLARLYPFGEYVNEDAIKFIKRGLPEKISRRNRTDLSSSCWDKYFIYLFAKNGRYKNEGWFWQWQKGIDSNTISAGEDNLFIIVSAIVSLKYYFESIDSNNDVESILLIDEFDATLHPSFAV